MIDKKDAVKITIIIVVLVTIFATIRYQQGLKTTEERVEKTLENCEELAEQITAQIEAANYCREDSECRVQPLDCPWDLGDECGATLVNRNYSLSHLRDDIRDFTICTSKHEVFKGKQQSCLTEKAKGSCKHPEYIACIDGKCVITETIEQK